MLPRTTITRSLKAPSGVLSARWYTAGSTGAPRGGSNEDSFTKREKANEDYYIKQHEKEQLRNLRQQLEQNRKQIENLEGQIAELKK
ncbi:ATPase inhibitor KNAG_0B02890 [Huiozyma naganishii CBS 8797]|uniref:ATPase inhibitor, mitochondrial n=1 Tax=Huiozyma naganishii (strain ATCC MYA-139 / BCRC 22969 / CBS 8797 / KCTC 17520 / NBRC 10181 / NCYC 3082 / Yp74L-3) TaxID=1071383 RepID=J7S4Q6_HUIN7|nr:hypothetical protein KNAG_0B02890 [Kazachstania naganishii CBS 8797]CCK68731.1 hypothetical protein KNAG_0B02890 [Kazachstania naganishii CBS 8797]